MCPLKKLWPATTLVLTPDPTLTPNHNPNPDPTPRLEARIDEAPTEELEYA